MSDTATTTPADQPVGAPGAEPGAPGEQPAADAGPAEAAPKKGMSRKARVRLFVIVGLALLVAIAFGIRYLVDTSNYVTTDNAQVDGNQISINAPTSGTLLDWHGQVGAQLHQYGAVGRIEMQGGYVQPQMVVRAPADGTVAVDNGVPGTFVQQGTQLAVAYDAQGVFVTARVDETDVDEVRVGAPVKLDVDAFPDADLTGHVSEIQTGSAGVFSAFPQSNSSGNFQKVTQVIPVRITFDDTQGLALAPGMNVTVKIHRP
ncbi:HlyD family secretion protein [Microlunatus flavus]|uniref:Barrel-sandwich domain of CusB or HlyD membrane-fusion n=1 Tax=Microlunatus flavus TaxID=1036181 RepID=A0A1H9A4Q7_9ACTN|nr:efflux RND transporter periplasmic adaptor subunit [Microlunatus flavus]SEP70968.1 Barrel-sandwich domain of CusB or HlyD membrane-fusion [Microlunatus flavus]